MRWQGPPFPDDRVNFDSHARIKDMDIEGVDVNMVLPSGGLAAFAGLDDAAVEMAACFQRRDEVLGTLSIGTNQRSARRLTQADVGLVEELANRAAIGIGGFLVVLGVAFYINSLLERREWERSQSSDRSPSSVPPPIPPSHDSVSR